MDTTTYNEIMNRIMKDNPTTPHKVIEATLKQAISEVERSNAKRSMKDGHITLDRSHNQ